MQSPRVREELPDEGAVTVDDPQQWGPCAKPAYRYKLAGEQTEAVPRLGRSNDT